MYQAVRSFLTTTKPRAPITARINILRMPHYTFLWFLLWFFLLLASGPRSFAARTPTLAVVSTRSVAHKRAPRKSDIADAAFRAASEDTSGERRRPPRLGRLMTCRASALLSVKSMP